MKFNNIIPLALLSAIFVSSCEESDDNGVSLTKTTVNIGQHNLETYSVINSSEYLVVFEPGLGDCHKVWNEKNIVKDVSENNDVLLYDRAGYGKSEAGPAPRTIERLEKELETVIERFRGNRKVILAGHSLGGIIIRDYAIKNPVKAAALLLLTLHMNFTTNPIKHSKIIYTLLLRVYMAKTSEEQWKSAN